LVAATDDDVRMRVAGVEVVDGHPVEPGVEVAFHLAHEVADEGLEIGEPRAFIGGDHEAELVRVLLGPVQESPRMHVVARRPIETARGSLAGDAAADDVLEMRACCAEIAADDARVARLDDDTPAAGRDEPRRGAQSSAHAALGGRRRDVAALPQRTGALLAGLPKDQSSMALGARPPRIADAAELHIEVLLGHETHLELA